VKEDVLTRTIVVMGTIVTIQVAGSEADSQQTIHREEIIERAFGWFRHVEDCCTRFNPQSESMRLTTRIGESVRSVLLYEAVALRWQWRRERRRVRSNCRISCRARFNREYITGRLYKSISSPAKSVIDVCLDPERKVLPCCAR
jgi:hypothetical protein